MYIATTSGTQVAKMKVVTLQTAAEAQYITSLVMIDRSVNKASQPLFL